ncbi:hypothetical protein HU200_029407 [Digitaria exilis]|uniref:Uncharacterized protein n=1 Tax=Digitaria exilis TaxID=1010633 RepID=A0A835BR72_9POAL|nr:hypothetical protein HU200_029407 [Digitaria exilis]
MHYNDFVLGARYYWKKGRVITNDLCSSVVATAVPAGSRSFPLEAGEHSSESKNCNPDACGATCAVLGINGVGVCKDDAGVPSCCCVPKPSASIGV